MRVYSYVFLCVVNTTTGQKSVGVKYDNRPIGPISLGHSPNIQEYIRDVILFKHQLDISNTSLSILDFKIELGAAHVYYSCVVPESSIDKNKIKLLSIQEISQLPQDIQLYVQKTIISI